MSRPEDGIVAKVDQARLLLAECKDAGTAKQVADMARAAEVYARRQRLSQDVIEHANRIKVEAMTLMGELLREKPPNPGARGSAGPGRGKNGVPIENPVFSSPKLSDLGISKKESSAAQTLADLKQSSPELHERVKAGKTTVAKAKVEVQRQEKRADLEAKAAAAPPLARDGRWRVITGDVCEELDRLKESPRLIFADPPYNVGVDYGDGKSADLLPDAQFMEWVNSWVRLCSARLAPDGTFWLMISDEFAAECGLLVKKYFTLRNWVVWYETFGVNCSNKFNRTKRHLFYCVNDPKRFVFHPDAVSRPSARQVVYNDGRASDAGKLWDDVWAIPRLPGTAKERIPDFPTQLPLELLRPIIGCCSDPGDLVLDPFSGSATTGVAAAEAGRRYVGIERSSVFAESSKLRLKGMEHGNADAEGT